MSIKKYYTLVVRENDEHQWCIHFGDYSRRVVVEERNDIVNEETYRKSDTKIICTADAQGAIDLAVDKLNGNTLGQLLQAVPFEAPFIICNPTNPLQVHNLIADAVGEPNAKIKPKN